MIGRRALGRVLFSAFFAALAAAALVACGAPSAEGPQASAPANAKMTPSAPDALSGPAAPAETGPGGRSLASDQKSWPFAPAPTADELTAQIDRLKKDPGPIRTNWTPPGKSERYGHAEALIGAPFDAVRARLGDFTRYKELAGPKFKKVSVVDKSAAGTDIYFQLPIMKGLVTIWYVTRFSPARQALGGSEVIEGNFVKGNIKGMHIVFTLRPGPDEASTVMVCDLVLSLNIPAPQSNLDEELRDACGDAANALRRTTAPPPPPAP